MKQVLHKHHIIPRHAGGTDDPSNLVELTIEEHAEAHRILYEQYNRKEDYLAWRGLSGLIGQDEMLFEKCSLNSSRLGELNTFYGKKHSDETKRKISEKRKGHSDNKGILKSIEHKKKISEARKLHAKIYKFEHNNGQVFEGTIGELAKLIGSNPAEPWKLVAGHYKTHKGWKVNEKFGDIN
jgi:hypothetical protein